MWTIKRGDTARPLLLSVTDEAGELLTHAQLLGMTLIEAKVRAFGAARSTAVTFQPYPYEGVAGANLRLDFDEGETDIDAGVYIVEVECTYPSGRRLTYPTSSPGLPIRIAVDVG